jgi:monoamine oxidase
MSLRDALVIGGGVAGLVAATHLRKAGLDVELIEARPRLGGRIHTLHDPGWPIPIELGAEFVHGRPPGLWKLLREVAPLGRVVDRHRVSKSGRLVGADRTWRRLQEWLAEPLDHEQPFAARLRRAPAEIREMARMYVEGFHAAPVSRVSALAIVEQQLAAERVHADALYRVLPGYDALVERLAAAVNGVGVRLGCEARTIEWRRGRVSVIARMAGRRVELTARTAIITLPLGVLRAGAVRFHPRLRDHERAAEALAVGSVIKIVFRFDDSMKDLGALGFVHQRSAMVPTWWAPSPFDQPILVGWSGGPAAHRLADRSRSSIAAVALTSLAKTLGRPRAELARALAGWLVCDWQADPFARGAYSWVPAGSLGAQRLLGVSVEQTLFFAGEATDDSGASGTIQGALESGARAAAELCGLGECHDRRTSAGAPIA